MASKNNLIGMNGDSIQSRSKIIHDEPYVKPYKSFAWNKVTGEQKLFASRDEYTKAIISEEYVDTPTKIGKETKKVEQVENPQVKEDIEILSKIVKSQDFTKPIDPKKMYVSQMNHNDLIIEGQKWGFDFTDRKKTKSEMRDLIKSKNPRGFAHDNC
jgi:hypothetical protein